jgi:hypothetical protein
MIVLWIEIEVRDRATNWFVPLVIQILHIVTSVTRNLVIMVLYCIIERDHSLLQECQIVWLI